VWSVIEIIPGIFITPFPYCYKMDTNFNNSITFEITPSNCIDFLLFHFKFVNAVMALQPFKCTLSFIVLLLQDRVGPQCDKL